MNRRDCLKTLAVLPVVGAVPAAQAPAIDAADVSWPCIGESLGEFQWMVLSDGRAFKKVDGEWVRWPECDI
jgi:hypothetical protein